MSLETLVESKPLLNFDEGSNGLPCTSNRLGGSVAMIAKTARDMARFLIVSMIGLLVDMAAFNVMLSLALTAFYANIISSGAAVLTVYFLSRILVFKRQPPLANFFLFVGYYCASILFFSFAIYMIHENTLWNALFIKAALLPATFLTNFFFTRVIMQRNAGVLHG